MKKSVRKAFDLTDTESLSQCYSTIAEMYQDKEGGRRLMVTVEDADESRARSISQNSLYWKWVGVLSDSTGNSKDEQHLLLKRQHLSPIFMRDDRDFADMIESLKEYRNHATPSEYEVLAAGVANLMSTTKANTKQMTEYLNSIDRYYYLKGIFLPKPDDYNWIQGRDGV